MKKRFLVFASLLWIVFNQSLPAAMTLGQDRLGNVFLTTETVRFPISGMSGTSVTWTVLDYFGVNIGSGTVAVSGGSATIQPDLNRRGWFELRLKEMNGTTVVSEKTTTFAVLTPISVAAMADSPFGVQTHFAQFNSPVIMPLLARAGIAHLRDEHYWSSIENPAGTYTYPAKFTAFMNAAATHQVTPLITLDWANPFYDYEAGQFTGPHTDTGRQGYANYGLELLNHYGAQLKFVEVWNEYNAGTFIRGPATADKPLYYYRMLQTTYDTLKPVRPDVQVLAGATVPIAHGFFRDIFAHGAMSYLDVISIHPYRGFAEGVDLELEELKALIQDNNNGDLKPIWASEFSFNVNTAARQRPGAAYLAKIVTLMRQAGVERMYYYVMMDDNSFPYRGLIQKAGAEGGSYIPNPAYVAYATAIRQLYGATPLGRVAATAGTTYAYKFTKDGADLHVLWANTPTTVQLSTSSNLTVVDLMGHQRSISPSGGNVALALTADAVYVKGPVSSLSEDINPVAADSVSGYSKVQGGDGWRYGYADLGSNADYSPSDFQPMAWGIFRTDNYRWLGTETFHFITQGNLHPGLASWAIRRWVSDRSGPQRLTGNVERAAGGDGIGFRIFADGEEVYNQHVAPGASLDYDVTVPSVQVGSRIDFAITPGGNNDNDSTVVTTRITDLGAWPYAPTTPTSFSALSGDLQVALTWSGSTVADKYRVKRSTTSGGPYTLLASPTTMYYTDDTVVDGTTYYYVVSAVNDWGESADSIEAAGEGNVRPVASASSVQLPNETADKAFDGRTNTKWYTGGTSPPPGWLQYYFGGRGTISRVVTRYDITSANDQPGRDPKDWQFQGSHDGTHWMTLDTRAGETFTARFQTKQYPVSNNVAYAYYRLYITANAGGSTFGIQLSELAFTFKPGTPPATPTGLTATPVSSKRIDLSWDSAPRATMYHLKRSLTSGGPYTVIVSTTDTSYRDKEVSEGATYYYVVSAENADGESGPSAETSATPLPSKITLHVDKLKVDRVAAGNGRSKAKAEVTILDNEGEPVSDAVVTFDFVGALVETFSGVTDANGVVNFMTSSAASNPAATTGCVVDVTHATLTYDPEENFKTCANTFD